MHRSFAAHTATDVGSALNVAALYESAQFLFFRRGWHLLHSAPDTVNGVIYETVGVDELVVTASLQSAHTSAQYQVTLRCEFDTLICECSCPVVSDNMCKHGVVLGLWLCGFPDRFLSLDEHVVAHLDPLDVAQISASSPDTLVHLAGLLPAATLARLAPQLEVTTSPEIFERRAPALYASSYTTMCRTAAARGRITDTFVALTQMVASFPLAFDRRFTPSASTDPLQATMRELVAVVIDTMPSSRKAIMNSLPFLAQILVNVDADTSALLIAALRERSLGPVSEAAAFSALVATLDMYAAVIPDHNSLYSAAANAARFDAAALRAKRAAAITASLE